MYVKSMQHGNQVDCLNQMVDSILLIPHRIKRNKTHNIESIM